MNESTQPTKVSSEKTARPSRKGLWIGILIFLALIVVGGICGGSTGILTRQHAEATLVAGSLDEQWSLTQTDIQAGRYAIARQRLEFILKENPTYAGAQDLLAKVIVMEQMTPTPSDTPTATVTPTADLSKADSLFAQAQQQLAANDWDGALKTLDALRVEATTYKAAVVDGMYYIALRNRGMDKLLKQNNLEGGINDLTLAERFGPLDGEADGLRNFAETYIRGASFWDIDWEQAVFYFGQVAPYLPYLADGSGFTAQERYRQALIGWGTALYKEEKWCKAAEILGQALALGPDDAADKLLQDAQDKCNPPKTPTETGTATPEGSATAPPTLPPTEPPTQPPPTP